MKPMMLIPPAQAEALFDAFAGTVPDGGFLDERFAPQPWLDEDTPDDFVLFPVGKDRVTTSLSRGRQAA